MNSLNDSIDSNDIAIIGTACRFPLADSIQEYWLKLCSGEEAVRFFSDDELLAAGHSEEEINSQYFVKAASIINGIEDFDADFFNFTAREAEILDPQQRILLECAYHALEQAGYADQNYSGDIGVFVGTASSSYAYENLVSRPDIIEAMGVMAVSIANEKDFVATQLAYRLNLTGPAINVNTACSTSLVAVHEAINSLLNFECDIALAGGATVKANQVRGYQFQEGSILSPDGHCRPFSKDAQGTIDGNGGAIIVLKRLADACNDGDRIEAVIKGSAVNNDGADKVGITAPSVNGQARVLREALTISGLSSSDIAYVETHGTGTSLGDPIEIAALKEGYGNNKGDQHRCAIGSVKSNMGHLDAAAGVAGLIKAALAVKYGVIPPSINFSEPSPELHLDNSSFYVANKLQNWPADREKRFAGVSSFGIGGTNAHVIIGQAPAAVDNIKFQSRPFVLSLSAKNPRSLLMAITNLKNSLIDINASENEDVNIGDICFTLCKRPGHQYRYAACVNNINDAINKLASAERKYEANAVKPAKVVCLIPGQGAQHLYMGKELYLKEPVFKHAFDQCCNIVRTISDINLKEVIFANDGVDEEYAWERLYDLKNTAVALFSIEFSLASLYQSIGLQVDYIYGHGLGEYVSACLCGVFSLEDTLRLINKRDMLISELESSSMLTIELPAKEAKQYLSENLKLTAILAPNMCALAGPDKDIENLKELLESKQIKATLIPTSHALHASTLDPILDDFKEFVATLTRNAPNRTFISSSLGAPITNEQACDPAYWAENLRDIGNFYKSINWLKNQDGHTLYLEMGPDLGLSYLGKLNGISDRDIIRSMPQRNETTPEQNVYLQSIAQLWSSGINLNLGKQFIGSNYRNVDLPSYAFDKQYYWIEVNNEKTYSQSQTLIEKQNMAEINYYRWESKVVERINEKPDFKRLIFSDKDKTVNAIFSTECKNLITVYPDTQYEQINDAEYRVNPLNKEDFVKLYESLSEENILIDKIEYAWSLIDSTKGSIQYSDESFLINKQLALVNLIKTVQHCKNSNASVPCIRIYTFDAYHVTGSELMQPYSRSLVSMLTAANQELPNLNMQFIDLEIKDDPISAYKILRYLDDKPNASDLINVVRGNKLWKRAFSVIKDEQFDSSNLREKLVVYIGGLGLTGASISTLLAMQCDRLIIIGRKHIDELSKDASKAFNRIKVMNSQAEYINADVSNKSIFIPVLNDIAEKHGSISLLIHGGGHMHRENMQAFEETKLEHFQLQQAAKMTGTSNIIEALSDINVDKVVLMSSLSASLGGLGMAAYAAANGFMDAYAEMQSICADNKTCWYSINWDGLASSIQTENSSTEENLISADQVVGAISYLTQQQLPGLWVFAPGDLNKRWQRSMQKISFSIDSDLTADGDDNFENISIEHGLAKLYQQLIGASKVETTDNFFDIGGDSLSATQLCMLIEQKFNVHVSIEAIFDMPEVSRLAEHIESQTNNIPGNKEVEKLLDEIDGMNDEELELLLSEEA